ncbi:MAG: lysylphosphatidylglycerol synthase domain-containing protein, partial [Gemmatimonadaceae bacterium]
MNKAKIGKWIRLALSAAIIVLLIVFARKVDWGQAWHAMITASRPLLLMALVANLLTLVARGIRWWILLRAVGSPSLALSMRATFAGAGLN